MERDLFPTPYDFITFKIKEMEQALSSIKDYSCEDIVLEDLFNELVRADSIIKEISSTVSTRFQEFIKENNIPDELL